MNTPSIETFQNSSETPNSIHSNDIDVESEISHISLQYKIYLDKLQSNYYQIENKIKTPWENYCEKCLKYLLPSILEIKDVLDGKSNILDLSVRILINLKLPVIEINIVSSIYSGRRDT